MAAVLAQMGRNAIGASLDCEMRSTERVRMPAATGVTDGGDVVYVDAEALQKR